MTSTASFPKEPQAGSNQPQSGPAFAQLFTSHIHAVCRILRMVGVPPAHIEDAAQEVFLVIHERLPTLDSTTSLHGYISGVAYRVGHNFRRKYRKLNVVSLDEEGGPNVPGVSAECSTLDAGRLVEHFASQLEDPMRDVFVMVLLEERPPTEVAELLGVSVNTVYSRVRLLREGFRKLLDPQVGGSP